MDRRAPATKRTAPRALRVVTGLVIALLLATACEPAADTPEQSQPQPSQAVPPTASAAPATPFTMPVVWNTPLPANPPVDANNGAMRAALAWHDKDGSFWSNPNHGISTYFVSSSDRVVPIRCTLYCKERVPASFPIPAGGVIIEGSSDGHLALINTSTGTELDFWQAKWDGTTLSGSSVLEIPLGGNGFCAPPRTFCNSANASGAALTSGTITPSDVRGGRRIPHALSWVIRVARRGYVACPATHSDGIGGPNEVPEGAHLFLPRSFVVPEKWPISAKQVAWALQDYGAIVTDQGSWGPMVQANGDFRGTGWGDGPVHYPFDFPWNQLQVSPMTRCL